MTKYVLLAAAWASLAVTPARAQNIVTDFLDRYRSPQLNLSVLETSAAPPASLTARPSQMKSL